MPDPNGSQALGNLSLLHPESAGSEPHFKKLQVILITIRMEKALLEMTKPPQWGGKRDIQSVWLREGKWAHSGTQQNAVRQPEPWSSPVPAHCLLWGKWDPEEEEEATCARCCLLLLAGPSLSSGSRDPVWDGPGRRCWPSCLSALEEEGKHPFCCQLLIDQRMGNCGWGVWWRGASPQIAGSAPEN